ncbi:hypothetical protein NKK48_00700 [Mesorhizobium sp. C386A]|uniref:hypothetical protein n=1 Tax=unclassified Mesorhizobium TaxID=325217 RepID=UPI0003CEC1C0|nr:hypothetical protein [Mesorhizobium sp. LNJC386A00]ESY29548.1 hypothetical protein X748_27675 [Mesorhizobium sp. LNJC386A00]
MSKRRPARCALCGEVRLVTKEHVVPRGLYPSSKAGSRFQRIVIPTCATCNNGTADDDAHFRNVVTIAGDQNPAVTELWEGPITRSFGKADGRRRALDLLALMSPIEHETGERYMIYPGRDPRVLRIVRKIVRGLSYRHGLRWPVSDDEVFVDVLKTHIHEDLIASLNVAHAERDILNYRYGRIEDSPGIESGWLLRFYERTVFIGIVFESVEAYRRLESAGASNILEAGLGG